MLPVVNDQEKSEASGLPARSFTPVAPPFIFAVYLVFASNFEEGVSVTEVEVLLSVALIGFVLLPEKSWTVSEVSVAAWTGSEKLAVTLEPRPTPIAPSAGVTESTLGAVVSGVT